MRFQRQSRTARLLTVAFIAGFALLATIAGAATAKKSAGKVTKVKRSTAGATQLARSIFEGSPKLLSARFVSVPPDHDPVATSTKHLAGFPLHGRSFAILSSGCASLADHPNDSGTTSCADGGPLIRGARDVTTWRIRLNVSKPMNCLSFRFRFLSEEYPEWVGSIYNDAFIAELDHDDWDASSNTSPTIVAPHDFAVTGDGKLVSVNGTGLARVSVANARGTTYDAATRVLRASTRVRPGRHWLYLSIFDQGDRQFDSSVFIDHLTLRHLNGGCKSGLAAIQ